MAQIFTARLLSGEHIIGELQGETPSGVVLDKALLMGVIEGPDGKPQIGLSSVSHLAPRDQKGHKIVIPQSAILCVIDFDDQIVNMYKQAVGSIITAPSSLIIP